MKKNLAWILAIVMLISLQPAIAEGLFETAPAYTLTEEELSQIGLPGSYVDLEELGLRVWLPEGFAEESAPAGMNDTDVQMMRVFSSSAYHFKVSVSVVFINGIETHEMIADKWISENNNAHAAPSIINGCESILCDAVNEDGTLEQSQFIIGGSGSWLILNVSSISGENESMLADLIELSLCPMAF